MIDARETKPMYEYAPRGKAWELFYLHKLEEYDEILYEGGAGTGKTLAISMFIHRASLLYPGIQILVVRKFRDSMSESCMKTLEDQVLKRSTPEVCEGRDRTQRPHYQYPNGSRTVFVGISDEEKIKSTEWDIIWINEATELTVDGYEMLLSRVRPGGERVSPYSLIISDVNPTYKAHFINQRFMPDQIAKARGEGLKRLRLTSSHKDNPSYWNEAAGEWTEVGRKYMAKLSSLTGARRERLLLCKWCSEEGQVYDEYDPTYHVIQRKDLPKIDWYFFSVDWGYRNAGVLQSWGIDYEGRMYLVHETYRTQETPDFWADEAVKLYLEYRPVAIVCDPAEPGLRQQFNDRLSRFKSGGISRIAIEANNDKLAGLQEVKSALTREMHSEKCERGCLRQDRHGKARMFFVDDALRFGRDTKLDVDRGRSVCTTDEMESLVWLKTADGRPIKEQWDDSIPHDGLDACRYAAMFNFKRNAPRAKKRNPWPVGTVAHRLWAAGTKLAQLN